MATLETDFRFRVRSYLGEAVASFWTNAEIDAYCVEAIRNTQYAVPLGALAKLIITTVITSAGGSIILPTNVRKLLRLRVKEPNTTGVYGAAWEEVTPAELAEIREDEGGLSISTTPTRVFAIEEYDTTTDKYYITAYPSFTPSTHWEFTYIALASESGNMYLPLYPNIQEIAVLEAASMAARKKSRDLPLAERLMNERNLRLDEIKAKYDDNVILR